MAQPNPAKIEIYIFLPSEVNQALADNQTTLADLLRRNEGLEVEEGNAIDPAVNLPESRDVATILIASSALVAALTPALTRVIEALTGGKTLVKEMLLEPASGGDLPISAAATPGHVMRWTERPLNSELTIKGPLGIEVSSRTS